MSEKTSKEKREGEKAGLMLLERDWRGREIGAGMRRGDGGLREREIERERK